MRRAEAPQTARRRVSTAVLRLALGNPTATMGGLMMSATAAAILINALALQSGMHPAPLFHGTRPVAAGDQLSAAPSAATLPGTAAVDSGLVADIQRGLKDFGYYGGEIDGLMGPQTSRAILAFERAFRLAPTGEASNNVLLAIRSVRRRADLGMPAAPDAGGVDPMTVASVAAAGGGVAVPLPLPRPTSLRHSLPASANDAGDETVTPAATPVSAGPSSIEDLLGQSLPKSKPAAAPAASAPQAAAKPSEPPAQLAAALPQLAADGDPRLARIQQSLSAQGFGPVVADGRMSTATRDAIRDFESYYGLPLTGEINEAFLAQLIKVGGLKLP